MPLAPYETPGAVEAICRSFVETAALEIVDPLILIPAFICDFCVFTHLMTEMAE